MESTSINCKFMVVTEFKLNFSMFTHYPNLRIHFRGAERFNAQQVQESERFRRQGQRLMLGLTPLRTFKCN